MKFFFDNNLSPKIVRALKELSQGHSFSHLRDDNPVSTPDEQWFDRLAREGGWIVISRDLFREPTAREAWKKSGLTVFLLASGWGNLGFWEQAWKLVRWWPQILAEAQRVQPGVCYEVPVKSLKFRIFKP